jgi:hypothetical protein
MTCRSALRSAFAVLFVLGVIGLQGCDGIIGYVTATYTGPKPASEPLRGEIVTIRTLYTRSDGRIYTFHADRVRFVDAKDPHNINRIVDVKPGDAEAALKALQPKVGDRLRISTQFQGIGEASGLEDKVPDWPYGRYIDYPIGVHLLTSVERAAP